MSSPKTRLFKVLNEDGTTCHGGNGQWSLPNGSQPGEWMTAIEGELIPCQNGYHLSNRENLIDWLGPAIFEAEFEDESREERDSIVTRKARLLKKLNWNTTIARLFVADIAEHALPFYESVVANSKSMRELIEVFRNYVNGTASAEDLDNSNKTFKNDFQKTNHRKWHVAGTAANDAGLIASKLTSSELNNDSILLVMSSSLFSLEAAGGFSLNRVAANEDAYLKAELWSEASRADYQWQLERLFYYLDQ
jgi:hypothetical protein